MRKAGLIDEGGQERDMTTAVEARPRGFRAMIIAILLGQFTAIFNSTIIATALPAILSDLGGTPVEGSWMMAASLLGIAVTAPIWGRLADRFNPVTMLYVAISVCVISGIAASLAQEPTWVIVPRAVQSVGLGGLISLSVILLARTVSPIERGRFMGWFTTVQLVGTLTGPFFGGLIVDSPIGWRGVFLVVVPLTVTMLVCLLLAMKLPPHRIEGMRIDFLGAVLIVVSISAILIWISFAGTVFDALSPLSLGLLGGGIVLLALMVMVELRTAHPILPVRVLRGRTMALSSIAALGVGTAGIAVTINMSLYFQIGRGVTPTVSGLLIVSTAVGSVIAGNTVGHLATRSGRLRRYLIVGGSALVTGATLLAFFVGPHAPFAWIVFVLFLLGVGQGGTTQFLTLAAQNEVGLDQVGSVSGFMSFLQPLGGTIMLALYGAMLQLNVYRYESLGMSQQEAYAVSVPSMFWVSAVGAGMAAAAIFLLPSIRLRRTIDLEPSKEPEQAGH